VTTELELAAAIFQDSLAGRHPRSEAAGFDEAVTALARRSRLAAKIFFEAKLDLLSRVRLSVEALRLEGLDGKWGVLSNGARGLLVRSSSSHVKHHRDRWWEVDAKMKKVALEEGSWLKAFEVCAVLEED